MDSMYHLRQHRRHMAEILMIQRKTLFNIVHEEMFFPILLFPFSPPSSISKLVKWDEILCNIFQQIHNHVGRNLRWGENNLKV